MRELNIYKFRRTEKSKHASDFYLKRSVDKRIVELKGEVSDRNKVLTKITEIIVCTGGSQDELELAVRRIVDAILDMGNPNKECDSDK